MVNKYNISFKLQAKIFTKRPLGQKERLQLSSTQNLCADGASTGTTRGEADLVFIFWLLLILLILIPIFYSI
jgi:hypothetical protein